MAEEKRGIEETKDILDFVFSFVEAVGKAKKDGEMSWTYDELVEYVRGKWDYDEENLDWIVDTAIEAGKSILVMVNMKK
jgi:hypothetical protein